MLFRRSRTDAAFESMVQYAHIADNELVQKTRAGQRSCFEVLVRRHSQALYRIGRMFDFAPSDISDLIGDSHLEAYTNLRKFSGASYRAWLTRIMIDKCSRKLEFGSGGSHASGFGPAGAAAPAVSGPCGRSRTGQQGEGDNDPETSPAPLRRMFVLREVEGSSEKETARLPDFSEDCIKHGTSSARLSMKKSLRRNFFGDSVYPFGANSCERVVSSVMARI